MGDDGIYGVVCGWCYYDVGWFLVFGLVVVVIEVL